MKLKHWIKIAVFAAITIGVLLYASNLLRVANEKDAVGIYGFYQEPEDSLDVVLIGSSYMYTYFYSPLAYEQYGLTSYALASSTMTAPLYRYAAEIAIEKQHPQLLVFETGSFCYDIQQDEVSLRKFLDALPDSEIRTRAINDIVPEDLKSSFLFPFEKYHSSWNRIGECLQVAQDKADIRGKGYSITKNYATTPQYISYSRQTRKYNISEEGFKYLEILLDYLKEADIDNVLFVRFPDMYNYDVQDSYTKMIDMIREAGFDFVNLAGAIDDIGIDMNKDFYNNSHLNIFGAQKFTPFFTDYIMKRYDISTDHSPETDAEWEDCASYNDQIIANMEYLTENKAGGYLYTQRDFLADYIGIGEAS
ncbi:MAG: hypothetical protein HUJ76_05150 [Parasporobacterium sp.]|nr:hypothetical protein [Parasporobacterium sp.]